jgi:hypothetical protein
MSTPFKPDDTKPRKHADEKSEKSPKGPWPNEGEGNKTADRQYREATTAFVKSGQVTKQAKKAADALDGPEGEELRQAEDKGRKRAR